MSDEQEKKTIDLEIMITDLELLVYLALVKDDNHKYLCEKCGLYPGRNNRDLCSHALTKVLTRKLKDPNAGDKFSYSDMCACCYHCRTTCEK